MPRSFESFTRLVFSQDFRPATPILAEDSHDEVCHSSKCWPAARPELELPIGQRRVGGASGLVHTAFRNLGVTRSHE